MAILLPHGGRPAGDDDTRTFVRRRSGERRNQDSRRVLVQRVVAEFREMPCLRLTSAQAGRLFGLRTDICQRLITGLVEQGLLRVDEEGRYAAAER